MPKPESKTQPASPPEKAARYLKILNMEREDKTYTLTTSGIDGATLSVIGYQTDGVPVVELPVKPDDIGSFRVFVTAPRESAEGKTTDMSFVLTDTQTGAVVDHATVFAGPDR